MTKLNFSETLADVGKYDVIKNDACEKDGGMLREIQETRESKMENFAGRC